MRLSRRLCFIFVPILCSLCAVAPAQAARRATVAGELKRMAAAGTVAPEVAAADRASYDDAKAKAKRLTGTRRAELGGVIADLDDMAARHQLTPSRLTPLFTTLQRNAAYWTTQPLLGAGARLSFPGS